MLDICKYMMKKLGKISNKNFLARLIRYFLLFENEKQSYSFVRLNLFFLLNFIRFFLQR